MLYFYYQKLDRPTGDKDKGKAMELQDREIYSVEEKASKEFKGLFVGREIKEFKLSEDKYTFKQITQTKE